MMMIIIIVSVVAVSIIIIIIIKKMQVKRDGNECVGWVGVYVCGRAGNLCDFG